MVLDAAGNRRGSLLEAGCGLGIYLGHLAPYFDSVAGIDIELPRLKEGLAYTQRLAGAVGEHLPFPAASFDLVLSNEVLEHVQDDHLSAAEMVRVLKPGGRLALFVPNRGYPFETHGIYWRGRYRFGNIPLVNYLPRALRNRLAPHVRVYSRADLKRLFAGLPVRVVRRTVIFGAYDNIIARRPAFGRIVRRLLQGLEGTPLRILGLSHFWVLEKE